MRRRRSVAAAILVLAAAALHIQPAAAQYPSLLQVYDKGAATPREPTPAELGPGDEIHYWTGSPPQRTFHLDARYFTDVLSAMGITGVQSLDVVGLGELESPADLTLSAAQLDGSANYQGDRPFFWVEGGQVKAIPLLDSNGGESSAPGVYTGDDEPLYVFVHAGPAFPLTIGYSDRSAAQHDGALHPLRRSRRCPVRWWYGDGSAPDSPDEHTYPRTGDYRVMVSEECSDGGGAAAARVSVGATAGPTPGPGATPTPSATATAQPRPTRTPKPRATRTPSPTPAKSGGSESGKPGGSSTGSPRATATATATASATPGATARADGDGCARRHARAAPAPQHRRPAAVEPAGGAGPARVRDRPGPAVGDRRGGTASGRGRGRALAGDAHGPLGDPLRAPRGRRAPDRGRLAGAAGPVILFALGAHDVDDVIFRVADALQVPVLIAALLALATVIVEAGAFFVELFRRRRRRFDRLEAAARAARESVAAGNRIGAAAALRQVAWSAAMAEGMAVIAEHAQLPAGETRIAKMLADFDFGSRAAPRAHAPARARRPGARPDGHADPALTGADRARGGQRRSAQRESARGVQRDRRSGCSIGALAFALSLVRDRLYGQDLSDLEYVGVGDDGVIEVDRRARAGARTAPATRSTGS